MAYMWLCYDPRFRLNNICPYFTMFPLEFPLQVFRRARRESVVLDVFCGRGTTNYAAQVKGLTSYGIDSSRVAVAIARAKLANTTPEDVTKLAAVLLMRTTNYDVPSGDFWDWAYHPDTLDELCRLRAALLQDNRSATRVMLRAIMLGALHGPLPKYLKNAGYFSNQMPRTFASKPDYSVRFWQTRTQHPPRIKVLGPIRRRAKHLLAKVRPGPATPQYIVEGNSEKAAPYRQIEQRVNYVITSPPYFGLRTYVE